MTDEIKSGDIDPKTGTPSTIDSQAAGGAYSNYNPYDPAYTGAVGGGPYLGQADASDAARLAKHREDASAARRKALSAEERKAEDAIAAEAKAEAERLYGPKDEEAFPDFGDDEGGKVDTKSEGVAK